MSSIKYIDFSPGKITCNNLDFDPMLPLNDENIYLTDDMLQVLYPNDYILDVSWLDEKRGFLIEIVQGDEPEIWDSPLLKKQCKDLKSLEKTLNEYVNIIRTMLAQAKSSTCK